MIPIQDYLTRYDEFFRLSEDKSVTVLLLEAGGDGNLISTVPMFSSLGAAHDGEIDWSYRTLPDGRNCQGMVNRQCVWHRGRAIGGTSNLDSMMYIRGG